MPIVAGASDPSPSNVRQRAIAWQAHRSAGMDLVKNTIPTPFSLDRLLPTPSRDAAVTDPSLPHTVNSAGGTCTRFVHRIHRRTPVTALYGLVPAPPTAVYLPVPALFFSGPSACFAREHPSASGVAALPGSHQNTVIEPSSVFVRQPFLAWFAGLDSARFFIELSVNSQIRHRSTCHYGIPRNA